MPDQITAELRVKSCVVSEFPKSTKRSFAPGKERTEEVWEIKAEGIWQEEIPYPFSLHFTTHPGHSIVPVVGKKLKITIEALA